jgi:hypothetical protein
MIAKFSKKIFVITMSFLVILVIAGESYAGKTEVQRKLDVVVTALASKGYDCRDSYRGKWLGQGDYFVYETTLLAGNSYALIGAGDSGVRDLDIVLYDENAGLIDRDKKADALPIVEVTPRWTGTFYVKVEMHSGSGYSYVAVCFR